MAETPMDIIMKHLSLERDRVESGNGSFDVRDTAISINEELRRNFRITALAAPWETEPPIQAPRPSDHEDITIRADRNPMLWYIGTDQRAYWLDVMDPGTTFPLRERQIALALIDLSANALREQTL